MDANEVIVIQDKLIELVSVYSPSEISNELDSFLPKPTEDQIDVVNTYMNSLEKGLNFLFCHSSGWLYF